MASSLNTLLVLMLKLKTTMMLVISKIIIFMLKGTKRSFATWSLNIWSTRTADTTWLADLDVLLKLMWRYTVRVKLSNAKSFIKVNLNHFVNLFFFTRSKRLPSRVNRWEEEALGPWWNSQVTNSKDFINIKRWTNFTDLRNCKLGFDYFWVLPKLPPPET